MTALYLVEQGSVLHKKGERFVVTKGETVLVDLPAIQIDRVTVFGNCYLTTQAIAFLLKRGVPVAYLSRLGEYRGRLETGTSGHLTLRQIQFKLAEDQAFCLGVAKVIVKGKVANYRTLCLRHKRRFFDLEIARSVRIMKDNIAKVETAEDLNTIRGLEGSSSAVYYKALRKVFKQNLSFTTRTRRPPTDPINALLSLGYTFLFNSIFAAVTIAGLDPDCGFFHLPRDGHPALVSDLMEEFRLLVDSLVLSMINKRILSEEDFSRREERVFLSKESLKKFIEGYDKRINSQVLDIRTGRRSTYFQIMEYQARMFADFLLGKVPSYEPYQIR